MLKLSDLLCKLAPALLSLSHASSRFLTWQVEPAHSVPFYLPLQMSLRSQLHTLLI